jgi:hypothetical protein
MDETARRPLPAGQRGEHVADQGCLVGFVFVNLTICPTNAAKVVENEIDLDIEPRNVGDEPRTTHDITH